MTTIITYKSKQYIVRIAPITPLFDHEMFFSLTIERENSAVALGIFQCTDMKIRADPNLKILANLINLHEKCHEIDIKISVDNFVNHKPWEDSGKK